MDIVPKASELSFENNTIRNTVPTLFRYIGNENDKTITKRPNDKKTHACQGTRRYQVQDKHHTSYGVLGTTCLWSLPSGKGIRWARPPRVCGLYRVVWLYGEHVRAALCGTQFVIWAVVVVPWQRYSIINICAHIDTSVIEAETYPVPGMRRNMEM